MSKQDQATIYLKCWPEYFKAVLTREKNFEIRKDDRKGVICGESLYKAGNHLLLEEWDSEYGIFTGRWLEKRIDYVFHGPGFGIEDGYVVMSISDINPANNYMNIIYNDDYAKLLSLKDAVTRTTEKFNEFLRTVKG